MHLTNEMIPALFFLNLSDFLHGGYILSGLCAFLFLKTIILNSQKQCWLNSTFWPSRIVFLNLFWWGGLWFFPNLLPLCRPPLTSVTLADLLLLWPCPCGQLMQFSPVSHIKYSYGPWFRNALDYTMRNEWKMLSLQFNETCCKIGDLYHRDSRAGKTLVLHVVVPDLIPSTTYGQSSDHCQELSLSTQPWVSTECSHTCMTPNQKNKINLGLF